ncbi:DUF6730 family protein [Mariniflexile sp. AS56]|uniref:DUF6730 family protein n=1 Tax=Mariniflexile sp. AS56 TaxID=3063957 RepID=UPI0026F2B7A5|nr:DUF6730 family protein [Mariniflexile sp. AS56]MDO7172049.1 hypothetical protein [Mariniflexile sp. AS56]
MTKLEELSALLVNEINDFKNGVEKLEKITVQIKEAKIKLDVTEYKSIIEKYEQRMESHLLTIQNFENRFEKQLKQVKIYTTWAVLVFFGIIAVCIVFSFFLLKTTSLT